MHYHFRKAVLAEISPIWDILQQAVLRRKLEGSQQWQDGYPNPEVIKKDIERGAGYVLTDGDTIIGYSAVIFNHEPAYAAIKGKWLTNGDFIAVHRIAVSDAYLGRGLGETIFKFLEEIALKHGVHSIKADTNFDNAAMLRIFEKSGYTYCGEVHFRGSARMAFEKVL